MPGPTPISSSLVFQEKFWANVLVRGPDDCWIWLRGKSHGYGLLRTPDYQYHGGERTMLAHRFAYEFSIGPIPKGLLLMHTCDHPSCCNPKHLIPGTNLDNRRDAVSKGRAFPWGHKK